MRIVDLTYNVTDTMLVWPTSRRPTFQWKERANSEACNVTRIDMEAHTGTHIDAPMHYLMDGAPLEKVPLDCFWGKARLFRCKEKPAARAVTLKMVRDSGFTLGDARIFVLETGVGVMAETREYNSDYPVPDFDLLEWLLDSGVRSFMTDATSIDFFPEANAGPRHKLWFRAGWPVVENLSILGRLPENRDFVICAMPLKLVGREGSPCRAAAWLDDWAPTEPERREHD